MKADVGYEIDSLKKQIDDLDRLTQDPDQLEAALLQTCGGLLDILNRLQNGYHPNLETGADLMRPQADIGQLLASLENYRQNLTENEVRYQTVVENLAELVCRFTPDGSLTFYNQAFERYFSTFGKVALGACLNERSPGTTAPSPTISQPSCTPPCQQQTLNIAYRHPAGRRRWQHWTGLGKFDQTGRVVEIQAAGRDITERKLAEMAATQQSRELSALHNATTALISTLDPQALLGRILDAAISAIPAARKGTLHLITPDTGQLEMSASGVEGPSFETDGALVTPLSRHG